MAVARKTTGNRGREDKVVSEKSSRKQGMGKTKTSGQKKKTSALKTEKRSKEVRKKNLDTINEYRDYQAFETGITIAVMAIVSLFLYLSYFFLAGNVGMVIGGLMFGIFGWFAWFLPVSVLIGYIFLQVNAGDKRLVRKSVGIIGIILSLLALTDLVLNNDTIYEYYKINHVTHKGYFDAMFLSCKNVMEWGKLNGGLIGRGFGAIFSVILGKVGATLILFALFCLFLYIFYGIEALAEIRKRNAYRQEMGEIYEQVKEDEQYREPSYRVFTFNDNRNWKQKTMRPLEKVPKVQTFDLRGQAEHFKEVEKEKKTDFENENEKYFEEYIEKEKQEQDVEMNTEQETSVSGAQEKLPEQTGSKEEDFKEQKREVDEIPIYRNELEEKFGHAKEKEEKEQTIIPDNVIREEDSFGMRESAFERFEKKKESIGYQETKTKQEPAYDEEMAGSFETEEEPEENLFEEEEEPELSSDYVSEESVFEPEEDRWEEPEENRWEEPEEDRWEEPEEDRWEEPEEDSFEEDSVMILDDFTPQKPMASFAPKEEVEEIAIGGVVMSSGSAKQMDKPVEGQKKKAGMENGNRIFSDFSTLQKSGQADTEKKKEKKMEKPYEFPGIDLLAEPKSGAKAASDEELRMTAAKLQETLESFNVKVKMGAVTCGPSVTRYELLPEQGVRVNKITNLADDLKLSLAAPSIRIEAPIPGKAAVGIEVPNEEASPVSFRELLEGEAFEKSKSPLTFAVGKDIAGKLIMADIAKMPHLLIAGATGSGKSVCINTLIMSILYKADPKDVKLIMIDPKVVELSCYNGIPHLFCPVVTDPKEAAASLNWAVREMMERYNKFKELNVRNISGYNEKIKTVENAAEAGYEKMPYLVVIVDEFADLMMVASKDVEDAVCRLAQLARAAGIHLVLATQRPSVNVITGVIKANIPSRIAFSVSSTIDSRTILDKGGAEKLLGKGDMLFFPSGYTEPVRVQGAFVSDKEVNDVVEFLCSTNDTPEYNHAVTEIVEEPQAEAAPAEKKSQSDRDEYFADAGRFVIESERAAAGQLQRHFSIGFNRAGRIIDQLEKAGVVGPAAGTKPRNVLMTLEEFERMLNGEDLSLEIDMMEEAL